MVERDWETISSWVEALGWNPGIRDGECMHAADPEGMFMAEVDGVPVGCITAVAYNATFGFMGALVVNPALRGQGHGDTLFRHAMTYLGNRNIGTDAMASMRGYCARNHGFVHAYLHVRFEGVIAGACPSSSIVPLAEVPFGHICDYDAACFPVPRERFLRAWLDAYGAGGLACLRHGRLAGFGVSRRALRGVRIGPMLADDAEAAKEIMLALGALAGGTPVALDVPEVNGSAVALAEQLGLRRGFDTARMYSHAVPELPLERLFGIASYELG